MAGLQGMWDLETMTTIRLLVKRVRQGVPVIVPKLNGACNPVIIILMMFWTHSSFSDSGGVQNSPLLL